MTAVLRAPQTVRVLAASQLGRLPLASAPLSLLLFARDTMSIAMAGVLVAAYTAGTAVGQPMLARIADRWRQPPVLWGGAALSTVGFALVVLYPTPAVAVVAVAMAGIGAPPFESCLRVLWRDLIAEPLLHAAYTLDVALQELIFIVGPLVALAGYAAGGARGGLVATAASQLAGTLLFVTAPAVRRWRGSPARRHWAGALRSPDLRLLLAATVLVGAAVGATSVAVAGYADAHGSRSWAAWLLAAHAAGALTGGLFAARYPFRNPRRALPGVVAVLAAGYLPPLLAAPLPVMAGALAISGLMLPPTLTAVFITADRVALPGTAAESFAWVATAFAAGSAAGSAVDGAVCQAIGGGDRLRPGTSGHRRGRGVAVVAPPPGPPRRGWRDGRRLRAAVAYPGMGDPRRHTHPPGVRLPPNCARQWRLSPWISLMTSRSAVEPPGQGEPQAGFEPAPRLSSSTSGRSGDRWRMLRLEQESEIQVPPGCLFRLGHPRLWCAGEGSNLHWGRVVRQAQIHPQLLPSRAPPCSRRGSL
ncbi:hypothetical protein GCM10023322_56700 [Rugosimonospora acidiphila]|uniref:MFS transporter n=1 Tax=Rugosimonospora acidiphila TaxID=556531 RepID=A0ABP9SEM9_9ACTN